jgi:hypothetical protein
MNNAEALRRAMKALNKACDDTENFDHGGFASGEIMDAVERALRGEFKVASRRVRPRSSGRAGKAI